MVYKQILLALFFIFFIIRVYFHLKYRKKRTIIEIWTIEKTFTILLRWIGGILYFIGIYVFFKYENHSVSILYILGAIIIVSGILIIFKSHMALGAFYSSTLHKPSGFIKNSIYQYIRHPMYLGFFLFFLGTSLYTANGIAGIGFVMIMSSLMVFRVKDEEKELMVVHRDYEDYIKTTPRYFPSVRTMIKKISSIRIKQMQGTNNRPLRND